MTDQDYFRIMVKSCYLQLITRNLQRINHSETVEKDETAEPTIVEQIEPDNKPNQLTNFVFPKRTFGKKSPVQRSFQGS